MDISDLSSSLIVNDIAKMNRRRYEKLLVELELFSEDKLRDEPYSTYKNNRDLAYHTFKEDPFKILEALDREDKLSAETKRALFMDGIEFGNSLAGNIAKPFEESSQLKIILKRLELSQVQDVLEQSLDNYIQGNFEASNAMSRNALEGIIQQIAEKISENRNDTITANKSGYIAPFVYRQYLHTTNFLDVSEKEFLDKFYGYASGSGSHPGNSSEAEARLRRFVVVAIILLFCEKLENTGFMSNIYSST
ncbi:MAG: hypothetical protein H9536_02665 [Aphanizomenon flos-aquae Clear-A1]|jgi:hypothetical protein|nr:hypothetical protein [Aphanizomenon flos-aquae Clear-A1]